MDPFSASLITVGVLTLGIGLCSRPISRSWLSPPLIALVTGVLVGPEGMEWIIPEQWPGIDQDVLMHQAARMTLAIGLMGVALRLPARMFWRRWRTLAVLLLVAMPVAMLIGGGVAWICLGGPWLTALAIGSIASPTDPVVASSIVTGDVAEKNLPLRLRRLISAESGINDGLGLPLVMLPMLLSQYATSEAWSRWAWQVTLREVVGAVMIGATIGWAASKALCYAEKRHSIEGRSLLGYTLSLTLLTLGVAAALKTDGVLAVFVAGISFDCGISRHDRKKEERIQEVVNQFFSVPIFALLGLMLPVDTWRETGWQMVAMVVAVLVLRRMPVVWALSRCSPALCRSRDVWFAGWFGPVGVAALFYGTLVISKTHDLSEPHEAAVWSATTALVTGSVVVHGLSAAPFTRLYRRRR